MSNSDSVTFRDPAIGLAQDLRDTVNTIAAMTSDGDMEEVPEFVALEKRLTESSTQLAADDITSWQGVAAALRAYSSIAYDDLSIDLQPELWADGRPAKVLSNIVRNVDRLEGCT